MTGCGSPWRVFLSVAARRGSGTPARCSQVSRRSRLAGTVGACTPGHRCRRYSRGGWRGQGGGCRARRGGGDPGVGIGWLSWADGRQAFNSKEKWALGLEWRAQAAIQNGVIGGADAGYSCLAGHTGKRPDPNASTRRSVPTSELLGPHNFNPTFWVCNIRPILNYPQDKIIHCLAEFDFKFYDVI